MARDSSQVFTNNGSPYSGSALYYGLVAQNPNETFTSEVLQLIPVALDKRNDRFGIDNLSAATYAQLNSSATATAVPESFAIVGTLVGGTAALRIRRKLKKLSIK